jgi:predicted GNAT family acetyltransferase
MKFRKLESPDRIPVYKLFRESLWDYMLQHGLADPSDVNDIDEFFHRQENLYVHLEHTASEDWVAEGENQEILGWARSIERNDHLQLTHFFVSSAAQGRGIGRDLLDLAFPLGRGKQRSVIATPNCSALSLYLRYDVSFQGMAFSFFGDPKQRKLTSDLEIEHARVSPETLQAITGIDTQVLGYERQIDLEFFMNHQPPCLFRRDGQVVAYAFGSDGYAVGPAAALSPEDLPALLQWIEQSACQMQQNSLWLTIPAAARHAVSWALESGYKMDPFHEILLAKNPSIKLDRFIMTQSAFIW